MNEILKDMILLGKTPENYNDSYNLLINSAKKRGLKKSNLNYYTEVHHIIPKCLGGSSEEDNLVLLTAEEHVVAHILLCYANESNTSLSRAVFSMLNLGSSSSRTDIVKELLPEIVDNVSKAKEIMIKNISNSVVCYDYFSFDVVKVYRTISSVVEDGFSVYHVRECISGSTRIVDGKIYPKAKSVKGYRFSKFSDFEKEHPNELNKYFEKINTGYIPEIKHIDYKGKYTNNFKGSVVAINDFGEILKMFDSIADASEYLKISEQSINSSIRRGSKLYGVYWKWKSEVSSDLQNLDNLEDYLNKYKTRYIIVSYDLISGAPLKIYKSNKEIEIDGFCSRQVQEVVSGRLEIYKKSKLGWSLFKDYLNNFPNYIEELKKIY